MASSGISQKVSRLHVIQEKIVIMTIITNGQIHVFSVKGLFIEKVFFQVLNTKMLIARQKLCDNKGRSETMLV